MQPESNESSTHSTKPSTSESAPVSQYGIPPHQLHPAIEHRGSFAESAASIDDDNADEQQSDDADAVQEQLRGLSVSNQQELSKPKPSFERISEYENALLPSPPRRSSEGPAFKVIKKKGNNVDGVQLDHFPNGVF